ncbi:MAG: hypothetical protein ACR2QZ_13475, partial [Woeseiaceae bacterium]
MILNVLKSLSTEKYKRLLPRVFPGVARLEIRDRQGNEVWFWCPADQRLDDEDDEENNPVVAWSNFGSGIERRQLPSGRLQVRTPLATKEFGPIAWLTAAYDTQPS